MKRLALALTAALLGSGCFFYDDDDDCHRTLTLDWTFRTAEGTVRADCADAQFVDVWVNNAFQASFDCFAPPGAVSLPPGASVVTVEGIDSLGRIAYRDAFSVDGTRCGGQAIATQPAEGFLDVDYAFSPVNQCAPGPTYIWLSVFDEIAGLVAFDEVGTTVLQQCSVDLPAPRYRLPVGSFTLLGVEEVTGAGVTLAADCSDRPFEVAAAAITVVPPTLLDSPIACF